ncbi:MAG: 5-(carboxyamino)imidazole ribonucleotide synthase, partial [Rhodospirillaceae bacterium]
APEANSPAFQVSDRFTQAAYDDVEALKAFAHAVDMVAVEFENIPSETLETLSALGKPAAPGVLALETSQDRIAEKTFFNGLGLETAPWAAVRSGADLAAALAEIGTPALLKTARLGYDGRGQWRLNAERAADPEACWAAFVAETGADAAVLEGIVDFDFELSVIIARGRDRSMIHFHPSDNQHADGILRQTVVPGRVTPVLAAQAQQIAEKAVSALDLTGLLAVELFATSDHRLLVNEMAPRPHNSGHWTMDACHTDQFEQFVRAVCGLPLGDPSRYRNVEMTNLIGADMEAVPALLAEPGAKLHLYGKTDVRPGRKMGHVNRGL